MNHFSVAILGGGHAGIEAAWMGHELGIKVALISLADVELGSAPCNPAIGGVGKGQIVREIDALGGLMGRLADSSAIQYRTLNDSKGHAVRSTRAQIDKELYSKNAYKAIESSQHIEIIREKVIKIERNADSFVVFFENSGPIGAAKIVITAGTFLNGVMHTGAKQTEGGRVGMPASPGLTSLLSEIKVLPLRFKTGTPPRLKVSSIDFSRLIEQRSDPETPNFHWDFSGGHRLCPQVSCFLTHTNEKTLGIVRENKEKSPIFNGQIKGVGPRYCPSLEDKANRYLDRNRHHVFIEPEGLNLDTIYPNGISTSLPKEVQEEFIRTIPGLENAEIKVFGYAVEYDVVDTSYLNHALEHKEISGLYFAGQINGSSGYEEAAGQGLVAGLNAALAFLKRPGVIFSREDSYLGVLIDDLVSARRDEPYRLFTARAENRLFLREDNVFERMQPYRAQFLLNNRLDLFYVELFKELRILNSICEDTLGRSEPLEELLRDPKQDPVIVMNNHLSKSGLVFSDLAVRAVAISKKYDGYIKRAAEEGQKIKKLNRMAINWVEIINSKNVSFECKERIKKVRPLTFGQLKLIEGIRPATLAIVAGNVL